MKKFILIFALIATFSSLCSQAQFYDNGSTQNLVYQNEGQVIKAQFRTFPYWLINNKLTMSNIAGYNCRDLRILRNCIFAYHGYIFKSDDLRWYFNQCPWYYPRFSSQSKVMGMMSKTEKANIDLIKKRERQLGC